MIKNWTHNVIMHLLYMIRTIFPNVFTNVLEFTLRKGSRWIFLLIAFGDWSHIDCGQIRSTLRNYYSETKKEEEEKRRIFLLPSFVEVMHEYVEKEQRHESEDSRVAHDQPSKQKRMASSNLQEAAQGRCLETTSRSLVWYTKVP